MQQNQQPNEGNFYIKGKSYSLPEILNAPPVSSEGYQLSFYHLLSPDGKESMSGRIYGRYFSQLAEVPQGIRSLEGLSISKDNILIAKESDKFVDERGRTHRGIDELTRDILLKAGLIEEPIKGSGIFIPTDRFYQSEYMVVPVRNPI
jgi:hypothetical protein